MTKKAARPSPKVRKPRADTTPATPAASDAGPALRAAWDALTALRSHPSSVADATRFVREVVALGESFAALPAAAPPHARAALLRLAAQQLLLDPVLLRSERDVFDRALLAALQRVRRQTQATEPERARMAALAQAVTEAVAAETVEAGEIAALDRIRRILGLSEAELARLLGVSRQAVEQWRTRGIPAERRADVDRLLAAANWLSEQLVPSRIPQIVRNPVPALEGRSMLVYAAEAGPLALLHHLARLFGMPVAA